MAVKIWLTTNISGIIWLDCFCEFFLDFRTKYIDITTNNDRACMCENKNQSLRDPGLKLRHLTKSALTILSCASVFHQYMIGACHCRYMYVWSSENRYRPHQFVSSAISISTCSKPISRVKSSHGCSWAPKFATPGCLQLVPLSFACG